MTIPGANETEEAGDDSSDSPEQVMGPHQPLRNLAFSTIHTRGVKIVTTDLRIVNYQTLQVTEWTEGNASQSSLQSGSDRSPVQLNASAGSSPRKVGGSTVSSSSLSKDNTREKQQYQHQHQHGPDAETADYSQQGQVSSRTTPPALADRQQQQQHHQCSPVTATTARPVSASQRQHEASSTPSNVRSIPLIAAEKARSPPTRPSGAAPTPQVRLWKCPTLPYPLGSCCADFHPSRNLDQRRDLE